MLIKEENKSRNNRNKNESVFGENSEEKKKKTTQKTLTVYVGHK